MAGETAGGRTILIGGVDLEALLRQHEHTLVERVLHALVTDIPAYAGLPTELIQGDVRRVVVRAMRTFRACVRSDGMPPADDLEALTSSALDRADEGVPLDMVLAAYFRGVQVCTDFVVERAGPPDHEALARTIAQMTVYMGEVSRAVSEGYARYARIVAADRASARQDVLSALLAGRSAAEVADRAGIDLGKPVQVLSILVGPTADEARPGVTVEVAERRKMRRLRDELTRASGEETLVAAARDGLVAVVPVVPGDDDRRSADRLVADLARAARAQVWVGVEPTLADHVSGAAASCREVARLARRLGRPGGAYTVGDLALELQITRPTPARTALAGVLAPLHEHPDLQETLEAYLRREGDRRAAAADLHVHANTIDNRLRRISRLTGVDPARPTGHHLLAAAQLATLAEADDVAGHGETSLS